MNYSDGALREGVLHDLLERSQSAGDVRELTIYALQKRLSMDEAFAARTAETATMLFEQVSEALSLDIDDARLLDQAAHLHEVGLVISHSGYHRHGSYLLLHADLLGFSRPEQECLALLVGSHRRRLRAEQCSALLNAGGQRLLHLCLLLRLSVLLNHSRSREPLPALRLAMKNNRYDLQFPINWLNTHPLTLADLEQEQEYLASLDITISFQ
jgi:exopolyphosphatase/guanosine-5'-triphosphate,3'-diphosphate pyrophosphatase